MTEIVRIQIRQEHVGYLCDLLVNNNAAHNPKLPKHLLNRFKRRCFPTETFQKLCERVYVIYDNPDSDV